MTMEKILLIDDDKVFNAIFRESLEAENYEVTSAFDGAEGIALFRQEKPDLIITDIVMPGVEGMEFLLTIMKELVDHPCRIIAISGGGRIGGQEYLEIAKGIGLDGTLEKPFKVATLIERIKVLFP